MYVKERDRLKGEKFLSQFFLEKCPEESLQEKVLKKNNSQAFSQKDFLRIDRCQIIKRPRRVFLGIFR